MGEVAAMTSAWMHNSDHVHFDKVQMKGACDICQQWMLLWVIKV